MKESHNPPGTNLPRRLGGRKRSLDPVTHLPMEWMDPMSWRLPSGKALAEFALQAGFLAPLILNRPSLKKKHVSSNTPMNPPEGALRNEEVPERSGTFRWGPWQGGQQ